MAPKIFYRVGDSDRVIATTKAQLHRLGYAVGDPSIPVFDHMFELAVKQFQQNRGLVTDGTLGPETFFQIEFARFRLGDRVLSFDPVRPQQGDDVADLQQRLSQLGIYVNRIDYTFGPHTHTAVIEFQRDLGLNPDGIVGPATVQALHDVHRDSATGNLYALREQARVSASGQSLAGRIFVIESGTSQHDFPTAGHSEQQLAEEAVISGDIARRIEGRLTALGAATAHGSSDQPELGDELGAAAIITITQDVNRSQRANGFTSFFYGQGYNAQVVSPIGRLLANLVQKEIGARTDFLNCGAHARTWQTLRRVRSPKVHLLAGYLTNPHDRAMLNRATVRDTIAESVVVAVQRLFLHGENDQDTGTLDLSALHHIL